MKKDTLLDMVLQMKEDVGLVHQMPFTCDRKGFPSTLEKVRDALSDPKFLAQVSSTN